MEQNVFENILYPLPEKPKKTRRRWLTLLLAAVILLSTAGLWMLYDANRPLVTAPGNLDILAYELQDRYSLVEYYFCIKLEPSVDIPEKYGFVSSIHQEALPLTFSVIDVEFADAMIMFDFSLSGGRFTRRLGDTLSVGERAYLGQQFRLQNNQTLHWDCENEPDLQQAITDIVVYADGHIIGCATLQIGKADPADYPDHSELFEQLYFPKLLGSVSFPKQDGRYQDVTEEDLQPYFDQWRQEQVQ